MLPVTPNSNWNNVLDYRRLVSPDDESDHSTARQHDNNPFSALEDSDSDDDESTSSYTSEETVSSVIESNATFPIEPGAADHLLGASEQFAVDINEYFLHTPIIDTPDRFIAFTEAFNRDHDRVNGIEIANNDYDSNNSIPPLSNQDTDDTASTSSLSICDSMGKDTLPSIDDYLRKEYQAATKSNFNFADAVVFREELGNGLARCQHTTRDAGHAYMVDTPKRHSERYGDATAVLPPPAQKVELPTGDSSGEWRRYDALKKIYDREMHWNAEALEATV
jgi:hypothetical protein